MDSKKEVQVWNMFEGLKRMETDKYIKTIQNKPVPKSLLVEIEERKGEIFSILRTELLAWIPTKIWAPSPKGFDVIFSKVEEAPFQPDIVTKMMEHGLCQGDLVEVLPGVFASIHSWSASLRLKRGMVKVRMPSKKSKKVEVESKDGSKLEFPLFQSK